MTTLAEIEPRLRGARGCTSGGRMAMCPVHESEGKHTPSLHVWEEDGEAAWHCFAGCDHAAVGEALGIERRNGSDPLWTPEGCGAPIAEYRYVDEQGRLLCTVVRCDDHTFPPWRPDATSKTGKRWSIKGVRRVLYRLPQVLWAVKHDEVVYIAEGEKDADSLHAAGATATCNIGGAGTEKNGYMWRDEYSAALAGAHVIIVADKDAPGYAHAAAARASLAAVAASVGVVQAKTGKDASDHLAAGNGLQDFEPVEGPPADDGPCIDWSTFWDTDHDESEWLYPDVLAKGRGHAIYAKHGEGKSLFLLCLAAEMATGPAAVMVLYCDYEMTRADVQERLADMGYGPETDLSRLRYLLLPSLSPLDTAAGAEELMQIVDAEQAKWPDHHLLVAFDTISRAVCGGENDADTYRNFYTHTGLQLKQRGLTWARNDHAGKDPKQEQRGSSGKGDDVDIVWWLQRTRGGVALSNKKRRMPWVPERVVFEMTEDPLAYRRAAHDYPARTAEIANLLERLGVPLDASGTKALAALRAVEKGCHKDVALAAQRWRRERQEGGTS